MTYIKEKTFKDFVENQHKLIDILNHNMTKLSMDVKWIKRLVVWIMGLLGSILIALILKSL